ncbi:MAG: ribosome maturation factor RimP [Acidobacteriota bacterium]|nr:MAG: ribosome maturation factor RimP [Acidobacteriota bacterium]
MIDVERRAEQLIQDLVESEGFELVHVEFVPKGGAPILRVYLDRPGGITISDCAEVSRQISALFDVEDFLDFHYTLEVSSPGIERPLFKADDFRRFTGKEIRLVTFEKVGNRKNFTGYIVELVETVLSLDCEGVLYRIPLENVKKANLVYRFE